MRFVLTIFPLSFWVTKQRLRFIFISFSFSFLHTNEVLSGGSITKRRTSALRSPMNGEAFCTFNFFFFFKVTKHVRLSIIL